MTTLLSPRDITNLQHARLLLQSIGKRLVEDADRAKAWKVDAPIHTNYRLLTEPMNLACTVVTVLGIPDGGRWEDDGGAIFEESRETMTIEQRDRQMMRVRGARKQRAARAYRPIESIRIVSTEAPAPKPVVEARLLDASPAEIKIAELEAKIAALLGVINEPKIRAKREADEKAASLKRLEAMFAARKIKV